MRTLRGPSRAVTLSLVFAYFPGIAAAQRPDAGARTLRPLTPRHDVLLRPRRPELQPRVPTWTPAVITEVPAGSGDGELGVRAGREDEQARVPSALAAFADGRVLVVDGENERLVPLDAEGRMSATERGLSFTRGIVDLVQVEGERFLAYNPRIQALVDLDAKGREYQHFETRELGALSGLKRSSGDVVITTPLVQWQFRARRATTGLRPMPRPPTTTPTMPARPRTAAAAR
ncbi:hypothetical protein L6R52_41210, partial [Myxococcota bacterium]|nr:hypothetical protein [Myxococcota bacterium]